MNTHLQLSLKISILHILDINIGDNYDEMNILKMVNGKIIYYPNTKIISIIEINKLSQSWALFLFFGDESPFLPRLAVPSVE